jgi:hypothetical protein
VTESLEFAVGQPPGPGLGVREIATEMAKAP